MKLILLLVVAIFLTGCMSTSMKKSRYGKVYKYQLKTLKDQGHQRRHLFVN